jgi:hypothetical protein
MIKNAEMFRRFNDQWIAGQKPDMEENLRIMDGMYELAVASGKFPGPDPLEGIEKNIRIARILRRVQSPS